MGEITIRLFYFLNNEPHSLQWGKNQEQLNSQFGLTVWQIWTAQPSWALKVAFFQKVRWNFFRSPNLKNKYSKKLSWAWNKNESHFLKKATISLLPHTLGLPPDHTYYRSAFVRILALQCYLGFDLSYIQQTDFKNLAGCLLRLNSHILQFHIHISIISFRRVKNRSRKKKPSRASSSAASMETPNLTEALVGSSGMVISQFFLIFHKIQVF